MTEPDPSKRPITDEEFSAELARRVSKAAGNDHEFLKYVVESCADEAVTSTLHRWKVYGVISLIVSTGLGVWLWKWAESKIDQNKTALTEFQTKLGVITNSINDAQNELKRAAALQNSTEKSFNLVNDVLGNSLHTLGEQQAKLAADFSNNASLFTQAVTASQAASQQLWVAQAALSNATIMSETATQKLGQVEPLKRETERALGRSKSVEDLAIQISHARVSETVPLIASVPYTLRLRDVSTNNAIDYEITFCALDVSETTPVIVGVRILAPYITNWFQTNCVELTSRNQQLHLKFSKSDPWPINAKPLAKPPERESKQYLIGNTPFAFLGLAEHSHRIGFGVGQDFALLKVFAYGADGAASLETNLDLSCCGRGAPTNAIVHFPATH